MNKFELGWEPKGPDKILSPFSIHLFKKVLFLKKASKRITLKVIPKNLIFGKMIQFEAGLACDFKKLPVVLIIVITNRRMTLI